VCLCPKIRKNLNISVSSSGASSKQMETEVGRKVFEAVRPRLEERLDALVEDILATIRLATIHSNNLNLHLLTYYR
jgi:hypothetical protein